MIFSFAFWTVTGFLLHLIGAACCAVAVVWLARRPVAKRSDRRPTMAALAMSGVWAAIVAAYGSAAPAAIMAETARNLLWILVVYRLFAHDGRDRTMIQVRPVVVALAFVELMQPVLYSMSNC